MTDLPRRTFLRRSGAAAAFPLITGAAPKGAAVTLVLNGDDAVASTRAVLQAAHVLQVELGRAGYTVRRAQTVQQADRRGSIVLIASSLTPAGAGAVAGARVPQPSTPESLALFETKLGGLPAVVACAPDARGLTYATYELVDRVRHGAGLKFAAPVVESPANPVRSIMRQFTSETYDKPWFYDRGMWPQYLSMLAANRFNRLNLTFGLAYDMLVKVTDSYMLFTYPFLLSVPGYDVKVTNLPDAERDRNLAALRYISEQTVAHGLSFELGLWMHGYELKDSPDAKYLVTGLSPDNHAAYCRDALTMLLKALPAVSSVGLRIHGESGVAEGSYDFWKAVFAGVSGAGRKIEVDLHAKGIDDTMLNNALATGLPVNVSPKFAAEHQGLPYHQADIRPSEIPAPGVVGEGLMKLSAGQRSFTRYGYADLMRDDRKYSVRTRVFYGSQRVLASGSADAAAAYGRAFQFCGMTGADLMEPLTFRGRRGTAVAGIRRDGYLPAQLQPQYDWQKYDYWYRSFGRMLFNPDTPAADVRRVFGTREQALADAVEAATLILPLITQVHSLSAACDIYWPETSASIPLASEADKLFFDTPSPKTCQNVTALDPQLFSSCSEFASELLGERSGKYSPVEAALWLDGLADKTDVALKAAGKPKAIDAARLIVDAELQMWLGRFYAAKLRAAVLMALHEKNAERNTLEACLKQYKAARAFWAKIVDRAYGVYANDLSISDRFTERGQWADRLKDIDADIAALDARLVTITATADTAALVDAVVNAKPREALAPRHTAPATFTPKQEVTLDIATQHAPAKAVLWYRHVNQAERWVSAAMTASGNVYRASIPAAYTDSPYPLQYYFEFRAGPQQAWTYPGLNEHLLNQPYIVLRRA